MTPRDGLPRFSARSACCGDAGHRKAWATTSESLGRPPFGSRRRPVGGRRNALTMHRIAGGLSPTRRTAYAISKPTFPICHPNSWNSYHFPTAKGTVSPMQPSDGMILVIGPRLEGHSVIFLAIQTHLSCRFCPSSKHLGLLSLFHKEGSGSSWIDVKPLVVDGSSGGFGWSVF